MEPLKSLDDLLVPDRRSTAWREFDLTTGSIRPRTLADHYRSIAEIELQERVPEDVRQHFQTAQHLMIYAWYVYRFGVIAEMQAYASLEYALRLRYQVADGDRGGTLQPLLRRAVSEGVLADANFPSYQCEFDPPVITGNVNIDGPFAFGMQDRAPESRVGLLVRAVPRIRNMFAHGSSPLWPGNAMVLRVVAEAINQLF